MINANMRLYDYFAFEEDNGYGEKALSTEVKGQVKMAIEVISQGLDNSVLYSAASYIGLTNDNVNDSYVINYENKQLKVLYVNPKGRYKQVYLAEM